MLLLVAGLLRRSARRCRPSAGSSGGIAGTLRTYGALFRDRAYVGLILVAGPHDGGAVHLRVRLLVRLPGEFGLDEQQFGLLFGAGAVWLIAATQLNPVLLRWWSPAQILVAGTVAGTAAGARAAGARRDRHRRAVRRRRPALGGAVRRRPGAAQRPGARAVAGTATSAGTAAALLGAVQFGVGAAVSPLVGLLGNDAVAMGAVIVAALVLAIVVLVVVVRPWQLADPDPQDAPVAVH